MAIVGRDLDVSERKVAFQWTSSSNNVGQSIGGLNREYIGVSTLINMFMVPFSGTVIGGQIASFGNSGTPVLTFNVNRFTAGLTSWAFASMGLTVYGTSGSQGLSGMLAAGNTLLNVVTGDLIQIVTSGANAGADSLFIELIIKKTQDIVAYAGAST